MPKKRIRDGVSVTLIATVTSRAKEAPIPICKTAQKISLKKKKRIGNDR